jgi:large conductance mechanosensitive channel
MGRTVDFLSDRYQEGIGKMESLGQNPRSRVRDVRFFAPKGELTERIPSFKPAVHPYSPQLNSFIGKEIIPIMSKDLKGAAASASGKALSWIDEFKSFALKGNVIDLAVGVIIGGAFGKIVESLVKNIFMPLIGAIMPGDQGYKDWTFEVGGSKVPYGEFLGEIVNFLIVALALFIFIKKFLGWVLSTKKQEAAEPEVPKLSMDQELLTEIRDLLKQSKAG